MEVNQKVKEGFKQAGEGLKEGAARVGEGVRETVARAGESVKEGLNKAKEGLKESVHRAQENVKDEFTHIRDEIKQNVEYSREQAKHKLNRAENALSDIHHEFCAAFLVAIAVAGIWLNGLLLSKVIYKKKFDLLVLNLAITNILLCIVNNPITALSSYNHTWIFGDNMCTYYGITGLIFGYVIMTTIPLIVIDEYMLYNSAAYINKRTKINKMMVAYTWINTLFWSLTPLIGWSRIDYEPSGTSCTLIYYPNDGYTSYVIGSLITCYILPIFAIYYCKTRYSDVTVRTPPKQTDRALALSQRTMMLLLTFIFCWTPYVIVYLWPIVQTTDVPVLLSSLAPIFAKLTTVLSPWILLYYSEDRPVKVE